MDKDKNCPICYPTPMGISPEGWIAIQERHDNGHPTNTPTSKCCKKCSEPIAYLQGVRSSELVAYCQDTHCKCHTPTTDSKNSSEEWESRFDEVCLEMEKKIGPSIDFDPDLIKDFIRSQIQQAEARGISQENAAWLNRERCSECGGEKDSKELSDMCGTCFEEA